MRQVLEASHEEIFARLMFRNERLERQLLEGLAKSGLTRNALLVLSELLKRRDPLELERAQRESGAKRSPEGLSWEELKRPALITLCRARHGRLMRA
jgi:hypothetical protein